MTIASRLRENAATSAAAAKVLALKDHDPGFLASLEQDNALLSEAADALDEALDRVTRLETALRDVKIIAETATVDEPVFVLPNKIAARVHAALDTEQT